MKAVEAGEPADLEAQLANKEREWKELQTLRAQKLEGSLRDAQEQLSSLRQRFKQLRDDFQYNLAVLEDRDRELERYDAIAANAQTVESVRLEELSQLRIQVANLSEQRVRETQEREQELKRSQLEATEHKVQLERLHGSMAGDIQTQREDYERMKRDLERRIKEVEGELALQKQEMTADFDHVLRLREHEFNLRMDQMRTVLLSHEIKVKLLSKEGEYQARAQQEAAEALQASQELCGQSQARLRQALLQRAERTALRDNRIKELERQLKRTEATLEKEKEEHVKKRRVLERALQERNAALAANHGALSIQTQAAESSAAEARAHLQDQQRALADRDQAIQRLQGELETTRCNWDKYIQQVSKETVARDTALLASRETQGRLKSELDKRRQETEKLRQQLRSGLQREEALEQRRVQVELDWQQRCEETKTQHYLSSQGLIEGLTQARDQAQAELRERVRELEEASLLMQAVTEERDQALQGVPVGPRPAVSEQVLRLQEQNGSLRAVVAQMRRDMEGLRAPLPQLAASAMTQADCGASSKHTVPPGGESEETRPEGTREYTSALEQEVSELKARCRALEEQLEGATITTQTPTRRLAPVGPENPYMQNHIRSLNETIGGLRMEKVASGAAQKKQEVRVAHLEAALAALTQQCYATRAEEDGLRLELANQKSNSAASEAGLRQRLAASEMELAEVRREKEEYQKGHILNNLQTVALGNEVSALKLDIASRREPIVCEQSEIVRQLREENVTLRRQLISPGGLKPGMGCVEGGGRLLKAKLKLAARCIARLTRDKQQLIAMGNNLRAELQQSEQEDPAVAEEPPAVEGDGGQPEHHPSTLEKLQYQLTKQELQYAQGIPVAMRSRNMDIPPILDSPSKGCFGGDPWSVPPSCSSGPLVSSFASEGSLKEVWQMLDQDLSPSLLTEGEAELERSDLAGPSGPICSGAQLRLQGIKAPVRSQKVAPGRDRNRPAGTSSLQAWSSKTVGTTTTRGSKIRNYNIRD